MPESKNSLRYPVFALKTGEQNGVACYSLLDLQGVRPRKNGFALNVFTNRALAEKYLRDVPINAEIAVFGRAGAFRKLVQGCREYWIALNPKRTGRVRFTVEQLSRAIAFEEKYLMPDFIWIYPIYAIYLSTRAYLCVIAECRANNGTGVVKHKLAVVSTDSDLADRLAMQNPAANPVSVPLRNPTEFLQFVRNLPNDVEGAVFDPPPGDWKNITLKNTVVRDALIADLEDAL